MILLVVKLNDARLSLTALAGPVTTSNDEIPESSMTLFRTANIGSLPYVGKVVQLMILSAVLEFVEPDSVPIFVILLVPINKAPDIASPDFETFKAKPAVTDALVARLVSNVPLSVITLLPVYVATRPDVAVPESVTTLAATIALSVITLPVIPDILARLPDVLTPIFDTTLFVKRVLIVPTNEQFE